jgi:hypothetical protein
MQASGQTVPTDTTIVKAAIYPPIGVARVGNSPTEYYLGPEVTAPKPEAPGYYRDASGAIKRQAARFRIYGLNAAGEAVAELDAANADIEWHVTLANTKAAWYQFQIALDIPEAADAPSSFLRNMAVADRSLLAITPGERSVSGRDTQGPRFDNGKFMGTEVYLGELRTDAAGRLIVLGGHGKSASWNGARAITFANNEGWHDDVADGPVRATVHYQGNLLEVDPAWIVVAPPDYAPLQKSVRTMWDLMRDLFVSKGKLAAPARPSFQDDLRPIFERLSNLQWVNAGFAAAFGWAGSTPFSQGAWMLRQQGMAPGDLQPVPPVQARCLGALALALAVWRRDGDTAGRYAAPECGPERVATALPRAMGARRLHRRLRARRRAAAQPGPGAAGRAARHAGARRDGVLPGRRVPPRL